MQIRRLLSFVVALVPQVFILFLGCDGSTSTESDPEIPTNTWLPITEIVNGSIGDIQGIRVLTLWGTNYEQGYAHGYLLGPEIIEALDQKFVGLDLVDIFTEVTLPNINRFTIPDEYLTEIRGVLEGMEARAGGSVYSSALGRHINLNDAIGVTVFNDVPHIPGCTSFSAWGGMTADGKTLTGRNQDQPDNQYYTARKMFIIRKPNAGSEALPFISIQAPGDTHCSTGMNSEGVTLASQAIDNHDAATASSGFSTGGLIARKMIESSHAGSVIEDVSAVLEETHIASAGAFFMSWPNTDAGSGAAVFEVDGNLENNHGFSVRQPEAGESYLVQTNDFLLRWALGAACWRYDYIESVMDGIVAGNTMPLTVDAGWVLLGQVPADADQGYIIVHAEVFQPNSMLMHVAFGEPGTHAPTCRKVTLEVAELLQW